MTAVLDGQQRLTALYIGLTGAYAARRAKAWRSNPNAYPKRQLYLCLSRLSEDPEAKYDLMFREDTDDIVKDASGLYWLRVGAALDWDRHRGASRLLAKAGLGNDDVALDAAEALHHAVHVERPISYYLEKDQSLDRVLSIFVRVNSGGTKLSHSDLLLSIATSQWDDLDARETIYELVDEINVQGRGFLFDKDFVLKSCLMVADLETRFSTANFTAANMKKIEGLWPTIEGAIRTAVALLVRFGLSGDRLMSANAVVPIVYYVARRGNPAGFATKTAFEAERREIRRWLLAAMLMRTFTGQPDSILRLVREAIRKAGTQKGFPGDPIVAALEKSQRPMAVSEADLDRFLDERYGSRYSFATLGLLYPSFDLRNTFHEDHLHPRSAFSVRQLVKAGVCDADTQTEFVERRDTIPNLQLLDGTQNQEKSGTALREWLDGLYGKRKAERAAYMSLHYIPEVDLSFANFLEFTDRRRDLMRARLRDELGLPVPAGAAPGLATARSGRSSARAGAS